MTGIPFLDAAAIQERLRPSSAVEALASALAAGLDPSVATPRSFVTLEHGELLLMPAAFGDAVGAKVVSAAPGNPERGLPRIQGIYILFDADTLTPRALLDGVELTALRTPAVSLLAVRDRLRMSSEPLDLVVAGTNIQAIRHVTSTQDVLKDVRRLESVTYLSRCPERVVVPQLAGSQTQVLELGSLAAEDALSRAGLVVCATAAAEPLFDGALIRDDAAVVAIGSHDPQRRELDEHLLARSAVVVEDVETAMREAGDVVQAVNAGVLDVSSLISLATAINQPQTVASDRPLLFKSTGMAWEDVVVASAIVDRP